MPTRTEPLRSLHSQSLPQQPHSLASPEFPESSFRVVMIVVLTVAVNQTASKLTTSAELSALIGVAPAAARKILNMLLSAGIIVGDDEHGYRIERPLETVPLAEIYAAIQPNYGLTKTTIGQVCYSVVVKANDAAVAEFGDADLATSVAEVIALSAEI